jgi:hypothetical protein
VGGEAADEGVGIVEPHHQAAEGDGVEHELPGLGARDAFALAQAVKLLGVLVAAAGISRAPRSARPPGADAVPPPWRGSLFVAEQDGHGDLLVEQNLAGAQDLALFAFGEDDALGRLCALLNHVAHDSVGLAETALQRFAVLADVDRHAAPRRCPWRPAPPRKLPK